MRSYLNIVLVGIASLVGPVACSQMSGEAGPGSAGKGAESAYMDALNASIDHMESGQSTFETRLFHSERICKSAKLMADAYTGEGDSENASAALESVSEKCGASLEKARDEARLMRIARGY